LGTKRYVQLWRPLSLLIAQQDFYEASFLKRLIHLLTQRTINIFQSLTAMSNDTSFDSASPSSKSDVTELAIQWFVLLRTSFLTFSIIIDGLINSTKKVNFINMLIDTILSIQQDDDILPKLIDVMIEFLWTFSLSSSIIVHDSLQKRFDLCRWLQINTIDSIPSIRLTSQGILSTLDTNIKNLSTKLCLIFFISQSILFLDHSTLNHRSLSPTNILICMFNADESHREFCITLRDRLQIEQQYSVELVITPTCQSIDSLIHLLNRSSLGLFCASTRMKSDNLSHFIHHYISLQPQKIPLLTILTEHDCELEGNWLENIPIVDKQSILKQIRRYLNHNDENQIRSESRTSDVRNSSHLHNTNSDEILNQSSNYMRRPVSYWTTDDVTEWCEATQGNFDTLRPLVKRLNGPALVHLAEILSIEPASMYHSLNNELIQRTGSNVPLTEYVSLRSELQRLLLQKQNERIMASPVEIKPKKRKWRSRFCTLI
jgi:hypothetical protein